MREAPQALRAIGSGVVASRTLHNFVHALLFAMHPAIVVRAELLVRGRAERWTGGCLQQDTKPAVQTVLGELVWRNGI
jgi:hypothetical protein